MIPLIGVIAVLIIIVIVGAIGYILLSRNAGDAELVFPATEVGTPVGDKVTKDIGPAGGVLSSPDGRLTITIPQNALAEAIAFSIQPISNKAEGGLGLAYRLEPSGKTFTTPLQVSVSYDKHDLEGTIPDVLTLAYQDQQREWHEMKILNQTKDTLTVATTHFSDWSFLAKMRLDPATATVGVGNTLYIVLIGCSHPDLTRFERFSKWLSTDKENAEEEARRAARCEFGTIGMSVPMSWLVDVGTITDNENPVLYTAPSKKPTPNLATVVFPYTVTDQHCSDCWAIDDTRKGMFTSHITIVDRGYRVSGNAGGDTVFTGVVCDLEKPFTASTNNPFIAPFNFTPSSAKGGMWEFDTKSGIVGGGSGQYTIEGTDREPTGIQMIGNSQGTYRGITQKGGGIMHLALTPLTGNECGGG